MVLLKRQITKLKSLISDCQQLIVVISISGLAKIAALTAIENKIPNISSLVKKKKVIIDYNTKISELEKNLLIIILTSILILQSVIFNLTSKFNKKDRFCCQTVKF